jgi:hypothetical protein
LINAPQWIIEVYVVDGRLNLDNAMTPKKIILYMKLKTLGKLSDMNIDLSTTYDQIDWWWRLVLMPLILVGSCNVLNQLSMMSWSIRKQLVLSYLVDDLYKEIWSPLTLSFYNIIKYALCWKTKAFPGPALQIKRPKAKNLMWPSKIYF